jgi:glycosyltransferase involved in cell wall biosynthesis
MHNVIGRLSLEKLPFVSVIIPTRGLHEGLERCLTCLAMQTYPSDKYEVLVVENSGIDLTLIPDSLHFNNYIFLSEAKEGSYAARNKGIRYSKGEILAFTDSDCLPDPCWIYYGVNILNTKQKCSVLGGKISIFSAHPHHTTAVEIYELITALNQDSYVEECHFAATANLFTYNYIFDKVGLFKDFLKSGGDKEWGQRAYSLGFNICYSEHPVVLHPARATFKDLRKKTQRMVGGSQDIKNAEGYSIPALLIDVVVDLLPPVRLYWRLLQDDRLSSLREKGSFLMVVLFVKFISAWERIMIAFGKDSKNT